MKFTTLKYLIALYVSLSSELGAMSQGFVNLNFESARIISDPNGEFYPYSIAITNALPGWSAFGSTQGDITYNDPALGSSAVNLWATNGAQLSGKYSVLLQGGFGPGAYISQTALVPISTESLVFEAQQTGVGTLSVSLGGQDLDLFALSTGADYTLYSADVSTFAGQTAQLTLDALTVPVGYGFNNWNIDNISFSSSPIPEPSVLGLSALGGVVLAFNCLRKKSGAKK